MKSVFDIYRTIENSSETYFAGANTAAGFVGCYADIVDEKKLERVYVIKGGSGTGKSSLMRKCAEMVESAGLGVKYYLCGSDPDSLDCVVFDKRIAVLDGTSPHVRDMTYPGAASELIDVSRYWDGDMLETERENIINLTSNKSKCYTSAYRYLAAAEILEKEKAFCSETIFMKEKAASCIERLIKKCGKSTHPTGTVQHIRTHALSTKGAVATDSLRRKAAVRYIVTDSFGCAVPFMKLLAEKLASTGLSITIAELPVPDVISGIFIEDSRTSITVGHSEVGDDTVLNMERFVSPIFPDGIRGEFRLTSKIQHSCIEEALLKLSKAAEYHKAIEQLYISAMDFAALDVFVNNLCERICERLLRK